MNFSHANLSLRHKYCRLWKGMVIKMIDSRIDTFLAVCKYMNFTKAAYELSITQPAVSQHIRYLEKEYQVKLFHQNGKKISLTIYGQALKSAVITMKLNDLHLRNHLKFLNTGQEKIVIGATRTAGEFVLPKDLALFIQAYPNTSISVIVANTKELLQKLDEGEVDCAIVEGEFSQKEYDSLLYSQESFIPISQKDYPFKQSPKDISDLLSERLILRESGSGTREILERYLANNNLKVHNFQHVTEISNVHAIKTLISEGAGITFLYEVAVKEELEQGKLQKLELNDFQVTHNISYIWRRNSILEDKYRELFYKLNKVSDVHKKSP